MRLTSFYTKVDKDTKQCFLTIVSDDSKLKFTLEQSHLISIIKEFSAIKSDLNGEECKTHSDGFKLALAEEMLKSCLDSSQYPKMVCEKLGIYTKSVSTMDHEPVRKAYVDKLIKFSKTLPEHEEMMKITKQQLGKE